ncbi:KxYKxGKxW signal peptide domain-containing protein, partial [Listeria innocua]|uniref:leucine-rich repeat domain-containing protein n=1 Tax=Listeria innocua TaxID=1642 RepID=UPI00162596D2
MRFSRKAREQKQKNWRMWKKGKQWLCGAALFFTVVSSPGMIVLADEVNAGNSTAVTAGEVETSLPEESTENEVEEITEEDETSSTEAVAPSQQEENTLSTAANNGTKTVEGKKERPKQGRLITTPTAISDIFPDANLAELVRVFLGKASVSDVVTQDDLNTITSLNQYSSSNISDLSGMEHFTNLSNLVLNGGQISDISALSGLTSLTSLQLNNNEISDISALSGLTNLTSLQLNNNEISDISALSGLTNMSWLYLNNNQISDISALSGLTNMSWLYLNNNQISGDVSNLDGMSNLSRLYLSNNQISEVRLSDLSNLSDLRLDGNQNLSKIDFSGLTSIQGLSLLNMEIEDINFSDMPALTSLYLDNNRISDISALSGLTSLTNLQLNNNEISDISALSGLTNLTNLFLNDNQISDISALEEILNLQGSSSLILSLNNNKISDLSVVAGKDLMLTEFRLDGNQISDLSPFKDTNVYIIWAANQEITLPARSWISPLTVTSTIKYPSDTLISPSEISDGGSYADSVITWTEILNNEQTLTYSWETEYGEGGAYSDYRVAEFSGTVSVRVEPIGVKILVDDDGDSQTTTDQTLFAEETSDLNSLEDIYNYAKEQLSGTDYGIVDIQEGNNGYYAIIVSKVGSLKTEDINGDSIGTDKAYVPTYTVTG